MEYYFSKTVEGSFEQVVDRVREALKDEGFGVLTDIDVQQTLQKKLNVTFFSGGVADMANSGLAHLNLDNEAYNLKIIYNFESGNYLSLINVKIQNTKGKVLLDTVVKGPWFFVRLPAGRYQVTTYFNRQYEIRNITVGKPPQTVIENWTL